MSGRTNRRVPRARLRRLAAAAVCLSAVVVLGVGSYAQDPSIDAQRRRLDELLDLNVRDGFVYYRALKSEHSRLDGIVGSLANISLDTASPQERAAFWVNAYNAIVLKTIVDSYPIPQRSREYPPGSIRQVPGAFERVTHRVAGRTVTLDQIEQTVLPTFHDPRLFFALGRGAVGSGRLRSEAYLPEKLEQQLAENAAECASRSQCVQVDAGANVMRVSSIFSWRRDEFAAAYADKAANGFAGRSPIERAILGFIDPRMLTAEREFLTRNQFKVEYLPFDWTLNDLTGRGGN
ncbi:MAG: DUF547 domain-containing protein [Vicinamibacterales bacterium]